MADLTRQKSWNTPEIGDVMTMVNLHPLTTHYSRLTTHYQRLHLAQQP
ncbi:MAG: hypothetical protein IIA27_16665 [Gemmatimonadetes bacterium]|nr:hypothetical protein [Gemmatimonadota bacterium]